MADRATPFWVWILLMAGGCLILSLLSFGAFGLWMAGTDNHLMRNVYAKANPDFEILRYVPSAQQIVVRHRVTGKKFRVPITAMENGNRIDYRTLATKPIAPPEWSVYPGTTINDAPPTSLDSQTQVIGVFEDLFAEHEFELVKSDGGFREFCNRETIVCAVLATSRSRAGETFFSTSFRGPRDDLRVD